MIDWNRLIADEQGSPSTARCAFWLTLVVTIVLVILAAFNLAAMTSAAYSLLGTLVLALAGWAGGPRVMQYLGPQIGKVTDALGRAKTDKRLPDIKKDDERGYVGDES